MISPGRTAVFYAKPPSWGSLVAGSTSYSPVTRAGVEDYLQVYNAAGPGSQAGL